MKSSKKLSLSFYSFVISCLLALGHPVGVFAQDSNLLLNPGFEDAGADAPADWKFFADTENVESGGGVATTGEARQDSEHFKTESYSLLISNNGPRWAGVMQMVTFEPGEKYKLSAWAMTKGVGRQAAKITIGAIVRSAGESGGEGKPNAPLHHRIVIPLHPDGEWQEFSTTFTAPEAHGGTNPKVRIELRCIPKSADGDPLEVWFDDVVLEKVES